VTARNRDPGAGARVRQPIEAVVLDMDGVLIEGEEVWDAVREQLVRERGGRWASGAAGRDDGHELL
jgi:phosphoserine phosphatase